MSKLVLVRHGESEWNKKGLWTGWQDIPLTKKGKKEARKAGLALLDIQFHISFSSDLTRAFETLTIIKETLQIVDIPTIKHHTLKERHYGEFTGKSKREIQKKVGAEKFKRIRRGWNEPITGGETLKDVFSRVVPYFQESILPHITTGKNILLVAHGNTIRALIKHIEGISDDGIMEVELATGEVILYDIDTTGKMVHKEKRKLSAGRLKKRKE